LKNFTSLPKPSDVHRKTLFQKTESSAVLARYLKASGDRFELILIRNEYTNFISECVRPSKKDLCVVVQ
jgi:hypothetical protein